jgi:hypothetical protein
MNMILTTSSYELLMCPHSVWVTLMTMLRKYPDRIHFTPARIPTTLTEIYVNWNKGYHCRNFSDSTNYPDRNFLTGIWVNLTEIWQLLSSLKSVSWDTGQPFIVTEICQLGYRLLSWPKCQLGYRLLSWTKSVSWGTGYPDRNLC